MQEEKYNIESGEDKAWRELMEADPVKVAENSLARFNPETGAYTMSVLGEDYLIDPRARALTNMANPARRPEYLLGLSIPVYLARAVRIPPSGEFVKELRGGEFFFRGSHALPLDAVAERFGSDKDGFLRAGMALGGTPAAMGDAAFIFRAFPKVVMAFVLWLADEEFPARASLLFDSNCAQHIALDVVWAVALVSCQRVLGYKSTS